MTIAQNDLLRVVYFSRSNVVRPADEMSWEIDHILDVSQSNNTRDSVTGALLFNDGVFAQVLEGPQSAVEETFERIQMDDRHFDVTLLDIAKISERCFADWSMGFVGREKLHYGFHGITAATDFDLSRLGGHEIHGLLHTLMLKNELMNRAA